MGYQTDFQGEFTLSPIPPATVVLRLQELDFADPHDFHDCNMPNSYNQWQLSKDGLRLAWDQNEKFYHYVEWLQYLLDYVLTPAGVTLVGEVAYYGEEPTDSGTLTVVDGTAHQSKNALVSAETLEELRDFRNFVLASDEGDDLLRSWQLEHRRQQA